MAKNRDYGLLDGPVTRSKTAHQRKNRGLTPAGEDEFPILKRLGLYAAPIKGDGNCLFRSLSDQYYGDNGDRYAEVRATVVQYMEEHAEFFEMFFGGKGTETWDSYIRRMAKDGVYGDNLEIVAFARRYQANVVIYQNDFMYIVSCMEGNQSENNQVREIHIAYHTWEHYSSVRNQKGPHSGDPKVCPLEPLTVEPQESSDAPAPQWKVDIVKKSIPYASTPQVEAQIVKLLQEKKGDIGATAEVMLMAEFETEFEAEVESEIKDEAMEAQKTVYQHASNSEKQDNSTQNDTTTNNKLKNPRAKGKRVTSRERKERQKKEALERKKRKLVAPTSNNRSVSAPVGRRPSSEDRSDSSSYSTPGTISQYLASSEVNAMYI